MNGGEGVVWGHFLVVGNARATVILSAAKDLAKANGVVKIYESS
jgi:hypothetical protein